MYQLKRGDELIAESAQPIVWTESELAWFVVGETFNTYYCDPERLMTVVEATA
jgi:hypothetical protein